ncbi:MAG: hypothetical protein RLZZ383_2665 [Pseudomonadota bacterium]|jgi:pyruvate/2-oxoglutarate dehydrogenase complex dihydrolipoamide acyltransferase (E2) component
MRRILLLAGLGIGLGGVLFWLGEAPPAPTPSTTAAAEAPEAAGEAPAPTPDVTATGRPHEEPKIEAPPAPEAPVPPPAEPDPDATKGRCGALDDVLSARYGAAFSAEAGRLAMEKYPLEQVMAMCEAWAQLPQAELEAKLASELGLKPTK